MITTTLKDLRKHGACVHGYNKVVCALKGVPFNDKRETYIRFKHEDRIDLLFILESNGLDDALWTLRASDASDRDMRMFAVWCARQVEHLSDDPRVKACNDVSERFANGEATREELSAAAYAARASYAAWADSDAAWAAWAAARASWASWAAQKDIFIKMCKGHAPWQVKEKR